MPSVGGWFKAWKKIKSETFLSSVSLSKWFGQFWLGLIGLKAQVNQEMKISEYCH